MLSRLANRLENELIPNTFDGLDVVISEFLPKLTDMDVDRPVANNNIGTPNSVEYFVTAEHFSWLGDQQRQQVKLFLGQLNSVIASADDDLVEIDLQVGNFNHPHL